MEHRGDRQVQGGVRKRERWMVLLCRYFLCCNVMLVKMILMSDSFFRFGRCKDDGGRSVGLSCLLRHVTIACCLNPQEMNLTLN